MDKRLYRSTTNKMVAGVCGGIGEYFNVDPTIIRLAWVFLSIPLAIFGGVFAYIIATIIIPVEK
ncbi:MAG: PspC domain-containing protein [Tissierellaceae bacterium]